MKGERCFTQKCAMIKKAYAPGVHGRSRRRGLSEYGKQLREKQRIKKTYGILERQLKKYVKLAMKQKGDGRENLMRLIESRLDNVVFRLGFASSRNQSRQLVSHRQIEVDKKIINIPSFQVRAGQSVALKEKFKKSPQAENLKVSLKSYQPPAWLGFEAKTMSGKIIKLPSAAELGELSVLGTILEYYSR